MPPSRSTAVAVLLCALAFAPAAAAATGGAEADAPDEHGGVQFGTPAPAKPVAELFSIAPRRVVEGRRPSIRLRIAQPGTRTVRARVVVIRAKSRRPAARIDLGSVRVGRTLRRRWPRRTKLRPGRYVVRVHARDGRGAVLARGSNASGETRLTVTAKPKPQPRPRPRPVSTPKPRPKPAPRTGGRFPVRGSWSFGGSGGRFGAGRPGHMHEGQDIAAPEGTPIVSPVVGTVAFVDYQKAGAGWYVVVNADDGRSLFFAHMQTGSVTVSPGTRVSAGSRLGSVGTTGSSSGPHLHFEIWVGGWRDRGGRPIDPLPQLRAWAG